MSSRGFFEWIAQDFQDDENEQGQQCHQWLRHGTQRWSKDTQTYNDDLAQRQDNFPKKAVVFVTGEEQKTEQKVKFPTMKQE